MRFVLIGPGIIPVPPDGWGAVEALLWETACELRRLGHEAEIINTPLLDEIVTRVRCARPDFVHLFYDKYFYLLDDIQQAVPNARIAISSCYPYIDQLHRHDHENYTPIFTWLVSQRRYFNFCVSEKDRLTLVAAGVPNSLLRRFGLGAPHTRFRFSASSELPDRTLCIARIEPRKRQHVYQSISSIDFVGPNTRLTPFDEARQYLGVWTDKQKFDRMTAYANLLLLSDGENGSPLVVKEALVAGLGVVVSRYAAHDLDSSLPFIAIVDEDNWNDLEYVDRVLTANRRTAVAMRDAIREYGVRMFSWELLTRRYVETVMALP